jgi:hypothetical protein
MASDQGALISQMLSPSQGAMVYVTLRCLYPDVLPLLNYLARRGNSLEPTKSPSSAGLKAFLGRLPKNIGNGTQSHGHRGSPENPISASGSPLSASLPGTTSRASSASAPGSGATGADRLPPPAAFGQLSAITHEARPPVLHRGQDGMATGPGEVTVDPSLQGAAFGGAFGTAISDAEVAAACEVRAQLCGARFAAGPSSIDDLFTSPYPGPTHPAGLAGVSDTHAARPLSGPNPPTGAAAPGIHAGRVGRVRKSQRETQQAHSRTPVRNNRLDLVHRLKGGENQFVPCTDGHSGLLGASNFVSPLTDAALAVQFEETMEARRKSAVGMANVFPQPEQRRFASDYSSPGMHPFPSALLGAAWGIPGLGTMQSGALQALLQQGMSARPSPFQAPVWNATPAPNLFQNHSAPGVLEAAAAFARDYSMGRGVDTPRPSPHISPRTSHIPLPPANLSELDASQLGSHLIGNTEGMPMSMDLGNAMHAQLWSPQMSPHAGPVQQSRGGAGPTVPPHEPASDFAGILCHAPPDLSRAGSGLDQP